MFVKRHLEIYGGERCSSTNMHSFVPLVSAKNVSRVAISARLFVLGVRARMAGVTSAISIATAKRGVIVAGSQAVALQGYRGPELE